jgi:hypothetical protein
LIKGVNLFDHVYMTRFHYVIIIVKKKLLIAPGSLPVNLDQVANLVPIEGLCNGVCLNKKCTCTPIPQKIAVFLNNLKMAGISVRQLIDNTLFN